VPIPGKRIIIVVCASSLVMSGLGSSGVADSGANTPVITLHSPAKRPAGAWARVSPARVLAGAWTPLRFSLGIPPSGLTDGRVTLSIPKGWARPSTSAASAGQVTASAGALTVRGRLVIVQGLSLPPGSELFITYGGGPSGATEPTVIGRHTFLLSLAPDPAAKVARAPHSLPVLVATPDPRCSATPNPNGVGQPLLVPNGIAEPNLHNTRASTGLIRQCFGPDGLTTSVTVTDISPIGVGPAGFPEVGYGYNLYDQPFCRPCHSAPFPLPVAAIGGLSRDHRIVTEYTLGDSSPSSLPLDFILDLWLERNPVPGRSPQLGDVELLVFLYEHAIATCLASPTPIALTTTVSFNGRQVSSRWQVCRIRGGTDATPVAFFLQSPGQSRAAQLGLPLRDFVQGAERFLGRNLGRHELLGIELGGEFDQCFSPAVCTVSSVSWSWRISRLALVGRSSFIPIVFSA
jgi:Glycosyl hydrolase family 12